MFRTLVDRINEGVSFIMGNHYSLFVKALKRGESQTAVNIYNAKKIVRESIKASDSSGDPQDNTVLHHVARLNLHTVYADLLNGGLAFPDHKNNERQNCLHLICQGPSGIADTVKRDMLAITVDVGLQGMDVKHILAEKDYEGNTVLHLAAMAGLESCVQLLIDHGADLSLTNNAKDTPADLATREGHAQLATVMETKVVFEGDDSILPNEPDPEMLEEIATGRRGLGNHELRSMKDSLLIETSNMLGVSLLTAQNLLREYDWCKETLLDAWMEDSAAVCEKAGVELPTELGDDQLDEECEGRMGEERCDTEKECGVCCLPTPPEVVVPCQHHFCSSCWKQYLEDKICSGDSQSITCPEYGCYKPVPLATIEHIVSPEVARKFLSFDIKAFVDSNPNIRWCPHAGCGQAVTLTTDTATLTVGVQVTVHCGNDHYFCWNCLHVAHEPCSCETWSQWLEYCEEMAPKVGNRTAAEADDAASSKWLADRSKPCPKCRSPIEKTEGCNHMCCKNCKHDFCWVCLDNWKCHNSSTGGYFECNRYDAQKKATALLDKRRDSYYGNAKELEAISRFLHYFERYKEHLNSLTLEEPFLDKARDKMQLLAESIRGLEVMTSDDMTFIEDAIRELLKCRRVLQASYPYAYYLKGSRKRRNFERLQGSLEQVTEMLAEVVARPHLRKPRSEIIRLTHEARTKRQLILDQKELPPRASTNHDRALIESSDSEQEDSDITTFIRMLEGIRRPSHSRHERPTGQEDSELQRVLELSRQEFEADKQLAVDIEKAKAESMARPPLPPVEPVTFEPHSSSNWVRRLDTNYEPLSWPVLRLSSPPPSPPHNHHTHNYHEPHNPHRITNHEPHESHSSTEWVSVNDEDTDLDRAIALSLVEAPPPLVDSNKLMEGGQYYGLPAELRHLLVTDRTGEHV